MDKEFVFWLLIASVFGVLVALTILIYLWFLAPPAWYVKVIGTVIAGGVLIMAGRSLWLNFIRPLINRLKDKLKKKEE